MYREGFRYNRMHDMKVPYFLESDDSPHVFFEPKPRGVQDDSTLEGCLRYASKVDKMIDKNNLYLCEPCTEEKYGKSKQRNFPLTIFRIEKEASDPGLEEISNDRPTKTAPNHKPETLLAQWVWVHQE